MKEGRVPLVVGLDGTITKANTFFELVVCFLKSKWSNLFVLLALLGKDQAVIKTALAERVSLEVASLPMNREVLAEIDKARKNKRQTVLATASSLTVANQISDIWGPFDFVLGSTPGDNMKAGREAEVLTELYGEKGFDYIGSGYSDIPALSRARASFLVTPSRLLLRKSRNGGIAVRVLGGKEPTGQAFVRALRPYQWVKNLLLLAPALAAHVSALDAALPLLWAFLSFSLVASSVYLANDLWDLESDRNHPVKKNRPLASGDLSLPLGALTSIILGVSGVALSRVTLGEDFTLVLLAYLAITMAYSSYFKRVPLIDVFMLAVLYGIRIVAGAIAVDVILSSWLVAFSFFAFLSLALVKRFSELFSTEQTDIPVRRRGYVSSDALLIEILGIGSGLMAGVILALYVEDPSVQSFYSSPNLMWVTVSVWLYWVSRAWLKAHRGEMNEDPVLFALKDSVSYLAGVAIVLSILFAR